MLPEYNKMLIIKILSFLFIGVVFNIFFSDHWLLVGLNWNAMFIGCFEHVFSEKI